MMTEMEYLSTLSKQELILLTVEMFEAIEDADIIGFRTGEEYDDENVAAGFFHYETGDYLLHDTEQDDD